MSSNNCFIICPIGEEGSDIRKRSDKILKHVFEPCAKECGYSAIRADKIDKPGIITSQVIQHIVDDPMVIADLTGRNPNVFYELAVRHAIRKPVIQIIKKGEQIPFDVASSRTISIDINDLDSVEAAKKEIISQMKASEDEDEIDTPITVSLDLQILKQSSDPGQKHLASIYSSLEELSSFVSQLNQKVNDPNELIPPGYLRAIFHEMNRRAEVHPKAIEDLKEAVKIISENSDKSPTSLDKEYLEKLKQSSKYIIDRVSSYNN